MPEIETIYSAVLRWDGERLRVLEPTAERSLIPFADNTHTAVDLLRHHYICRMNVSQSVLDDIGERLRVHRYSLLSHAHRGGNPGRST